MRGGAMIALLVVGAVAFYVFTTRNRAAQVAKAAGASTSPTGIPAIASDPNSTQTKALSDQIAALAGIVGYTAGKSAGSSLSGAEGGVARGLGEPRVNFSDVQGLVSNAYQTGLAAGAVSGANAGSGAGGASGAFIASLPDTFVQGIVAAQRTGATSPYRPQSIYEVPVLGALARLQDGGAIPTWDTKSGQFVWGKLN